MLYAYVTVIAFHVETAQIRWENKEGSREIMAVCQQSLYQILCHMVISDLKVEGLSMCAQEGIQVIFTTPGSCLAFTDLQIHT